MGNLSKVLKAKGVKLPGTGRDKPLWDGPESDTDNGGITFSSLSRYLCCKERFRIAMIEGLRPTELFSHRAEYGQMWHTCEEALAKEGKWFDALSKYLVECCKKYPYSQEEIRHWANVCRIQFPLYVDYWSKHKDVTSRTPLLQEHVFKIPYRLPSGRVVYLRGKYDSVDLIDLGKSPGIWLQENKTKGQINQQQITRQLKYDLQTGIYLVALDEAQTTMDFEKGPVIQEYLEKTPIKGVRYNVIRRPLSGGKGTIVQKKATKNHPAETKEEYYGRLATYIKEEPGEYFMRWTVSITPEDIANFRKRCLDPILEELCKWYEMVVAHNDPFSPSNNREHWLHYQFPFGVFNTTLENGISDLDEYLDNGSEVGLHRVDSLFNELK